jgi:hypothetical protein
MPAAYCRQFITYNGATMLDALKLLLVGLLIEVIWYYLRRWLDRGRSKN